jgi:hypothetical protein
LAAVGVKLSGTVSCDEGVLELAHLIECESAAGLHVFDGLLIVLVATLGRPAVPGRMIPQLIRRGISSDCLAWHYDYSLTELVERLAGAAECSVEAKLSGEALEACRAGYDDDRSVTA